MNLERWLRLMAAWDFGRNQKTFDSLMLAYSDNSRHYHSTQHISACLRHLEACTAALDSPREVEIALWFHDAIYKPISRNNEKESADLAASFLAECGATKEETARVHRLIMVTAHNAATQTRDEAALVDIDLLILAADPSRYEIFEQGVRKEYRLVPSVIYRRKRAEVLRSFMERPQIYTSGIFSEEAERQARENLSNAVSKLESPRAK